MSGPWYECQGPTAEQVRKDVSEYISTNSSNINYPLTNDILLKIIPDSRNDFGSWRGYGTFGVAKEIATEVMNEMKKRESALTLLKNRFTPYCMYKLYNPDNGLMMKRISKTTMVGKNSAIV
jgi:hypothetical protein